MQNANRLGRHKSGNSALGRLLKARREAAGLSLTKLAAELGVTRQYLSRIERGDYEHPSFKLINQVTKQLDISLEDVYIATGYTLPKELPSFGPYVRAKHTDWPEDVVQQLESFYEFLKYKYTLE